ncbi:Osmotically-inducible putative lipoprotein OsmE [compost metagenome]
MYKPTLAMLCVLGSVAGCGSMKPENPVDYYTYRNEPLVKQVDDGMTRQQVLSIGGTPSSEVKRNVQPGTCNNYILNQDGHQQAYYVSFDSAGRVDSKGFMSCAQHEQNQREREKL